MVRIVLDVVELQLVTQDAKRPDAGGRRNGVRQIGRQLLGDQHGLNTLEHQPAKLAAAFGLPYQRLERPGDLAKALQGIGLRVVEAQTSRAGGTELRARLRAAALGW